MKIMMRNCILLAVAAFLVTPAIAAVSNGGFETGDLTGWTSVIPQGASIEITSLHTSSPLGASGTTSWSATEGNYFARLKTDGPASLTQLFQSFTVEAGEKLSFDYFWDGGDTIGYDDNGMGMILTGTGTGGAEVEQLFYESINTNPSDFYGTDWISVDYVFNTAGTYTLLFQNKNAGDSLNDSFVGIDNVALTPQPVPVPGAILLGSMGCGLVGWLKRRRCL